MSEPPTAGLSRLLDQALQRRNGADQTEEAHRLATVWALLAGTWPREARRFDSTLRY